MKVVAYTALHYGSDYLAYAIKSVIDHVDEYWVIYSDEGSHGHKTNARCPDTREQLMDIAVKAAGDKLGWIDGKWAYEGAQREAIHQLAPDADVILVVDSDEVWGDGLAEYVTEIYMRFKVNNMAWKSQRVRIPMVHFWRSFYRCITHDPAYPERVIFPKEKDKPTITLDKSDGLIAHFGYAQRPEIVRYKLETHGHKNEFRRDCDWFNDVFMANRQTDCHPVGSEYWWPEAVDPWKYLPDFMRQHPFANLEVIE